MNYNQRFEESFNKLNEAQRKAVEHTQGPVIVIAGPGTGKTQILSTRIGHILNTQDVNPENILCLTFTNAGRSAMKKRLVALIGPTGDMVEVHTFHSFCLKVIHDKPESFPDFDGDNMTKLEKFELVLDMVKDIPTDNILKQDLKIVEILVQKFINLFELMAKENLSAEFITNKITSYETEIRENPDNISNKSPRVGLLKNEALKKLIGLDLTLEAVKYYETYQKLKVKKLKYDFDDMISGVVAAFEKDDTLILDYQEKFQYILVDEFQDTNGSQARILELLCDYENPNVFIVGDDDQAVYEFQGAKIDNFYEFRAKHTPNIEQIVLTENYRSVPSILAFSNRLIDNNQIRLIKDGTLQLDKQIVSSHPDLKTQSIKPITVECISKSYEKAFIVETIQKLHNEGISYDEMAIIYRTNASGKDFIKTLNEFHIPYQAKNDINILEDDLFLIFKKLLIYINDEKQRPEKADWAVFELLHAPFLGISHSEIEKMAMYRVANTVRNEDERKSPTWKFICRNIETLDIVSLDTQSKIKAFIELTDTLISDHINLKLPRFVEELYFKSGIFSYIISHENKFENVEIFNTFKRMVASEFEKKPGLKIDDILLMLEKMKKCSFSLDISRNLGTSGVHLLTAHGSKGLEFEVVFLPYINADKWESNSKGNPPKFKLPNNLVDAIEDHNHETERRLMYIATTRAQKHLYYTYSNEGSRKKSKFLTELLGENEAIIASNENSLIDKNVAFEIEKLDLIAQPLLEENTELAIQTILQDFKLSATSFNAYLKCPISFYFEKILKVETEPSENLMYGTSMHYALEHFHRNMLRNVPKAYGSESLLIDLFSKKWNEYEYQLDELIFKTKLAYGKSGLKRFYKEKVSNLTTEVELEKSFNFKNDNGTYFYGKIDKIELNNDFLTIIDYKTGSDNSGKFSKILEHNEKGESFKQACFYAYLVYKVTNRLPNMIKFQFLDKQTNKDVIVERNIEVNLETLDAFEKLADEVFEKIKNKEFFKGCGKPNCNWCNFTKTNGIAYEYDYGDYIDYNESDESTD